MQKIEVDGGELSIDLKSGTISFRDLSVPAHIRAYESGASFSMIKLLPDKPDCEWVKFLKFQGEGHIKNKDGNIAMVIRKKDYIYNPMTEELKLKEEEK